MQSRGDHADCRGGHDKKNREKTNGPVMGPSDTILNSISVATVGNKIVEAADTSSEICKDTTALGRSDSQPPIALPKLMAKSTTPIYAVQV